MLALVEQPRVAQLERVGAAVLVRIWCERWRHMTVQGQTQQPCHQPLFRCPALTMKVAERVRILHDDLLIC